MVQGLLLGEARIPGDERLEQRVVVVCGQHVGVQRCHAQPDVALGDCPELVEDPTPDPVNRGLDQLPVEVLVAPESRIDIRARFGRETTARRLGRGNQRWMIRRFGVRGCLFFSHSQTRHHR
jgi:hypothetical protein